MNGKDKEKENYVSVGRAAELSGLSTQTIRKFADQGTIQSYRTPSGQRRFNKLSLQEMFGTKMFIEKVSSDQKLNFIYTRVSSKKQFDDLARQLEYIRSKDSIYSSYISIQDIGSGINFKRKGLETILDRCTQKNIGEIIIAHRDRLCRFGFELIKMFVEKSGGSIKIIDDEQHKSSEQELSEDLLSIVQLYSCKQMGKRKYKTKLPPKGSEDKTKTVNETDLEIKTVV